jgi:hypothetical protein
MAGLLNEHSLFSSPEDAQCYFPNHRRQPRPVRSPNNRDPINSVGSSERGDLVALNDQGSNEGAEHVDYRM